MRRTLYALLLAGVGMLGCQAGVAQGNLHTDPLNLDPMVRQGYEHFYNLDYDGAIRIFAQVRQEHPQSPMACDYMLLAVMFKELYKQDLLDTTYYAHDSFLANKRDIQVESSVRAQIESLTSCAIQLSDAALKANPNDKNAYFARGYAKGLHGAFITLADHSFAAAARQGYSARNDSEAALKIDPQYADAELAVGIQQFAVASLPRFVRMMVGIMGVGGNKEQGIAKLKEAAAHGVVTAIEARTTLSLFLRHDGRYPEALQVQRGLAEQYPHDYLFRLEVANLTKDEGHGLEAIAAYKAVLADAARPGYFLDPHLQMAWFGMADTQRGYNMISDAAYGYTQAAMQPNCSDWLRKRAYVNAGEMYDLLKNRGKAVAMYQKALTPGGDQTQAETARRYLKVPYIGK